MAKIKVYLPTFRRHGMVPRALESLRSQTFKDWVCEVHNDDPSDKFPGELVAKLADPRISVVNHPVNLGGAATMNAFYAPCKEEFISILEDDNWWEAEFLDEMTKAAHLHPERRIFWSNMRVWQEEKDGKFSFAGKTLHPLEGSEYQEFAWPDPRQTMGAVHSNGACLIRTAPSVDYRIPAVPLSTIEMFRERAFPHPIILIRKPLANFSVTLSTERASDGVAYGEAVAVLAATFFHKAEWPESKFAQTLEQGRLNQPPPTHTLLNAALLEPKARVLFRLATIPELLRWIAGLARRPVLLWRLIFSRRNRSDWWQFLARHTAERFAETRAKASQV